MKPRANKQFLLSNLSVLGLDRVQNVRGPCVQGSALLKKNASKQLPIGRMDEQIVIKVKITTHTKSAQKE